MWVFSIIFNKMIVNANVQSLIFILFLFNNLCHAQKDFPFGRSDFLINGELLGEAQNKKTPTLIIRKNQFRINFKTGYFLSDKNLVMVKIESDLLNSKSLKSSSQDTDYELEATIVFRRYFPLNLFSEVYFGVEHYLYKSVNLSETIDIDKVLKFGLGLGHTYFLSKHVGLEFSIYTDLNRITFKRESIETYNFWRIGTNIGLIYFFKFKKLKLNNHD
jgi:hypothetical protein